MTRRINALLGSAAASVLVLMLGQGANAQTVLTATLTNAGEPGGVTPTTSTGGFRLASFGLATFVLNDARTEMTMDVTVNNIDFTGTQTADTFDNLIAAHIHASATVTPTTNAGVVWGFFGLPQNTADDVVVTPFPTGVGGMITATWDANEGNGTTLAAQLNNILTTHSYINFHTTQFGGGEVRGMITVVPEPTALLSLGVGAFALAGVRRRGRATR